MSAGVHDLNKKLHTPPTSNMSVDVHNKKLHTSSVSPCMLWFFFSISATSASFTHHRNPVTDRMVFAALERIFTLVS